MRIELVEWPESQYCMDCKHSAFVDSNDERVGDSAYICFMNTYPKAERCENVRIQKEEEKIDE